MLKINQLNCGYDGKIVVKNKMLVSGDFDKIRRDLLGLKDKINIIAKEL